MLFSIGKLCGKVGFFAREKFIYFELYNIGKLDTWLGTRFLRLENVPIEISSLKSTTKMITLSLSG